MENCAIAKGVYRHTKSDRLYEVIGSAHHTETDELMVVYRPLYDSEYELFVRPHGMFIDTVVITGQSVARFTFEENS